MAEMNATRSARQLKIRHLGRGSQVWIYLGKQLRMFLYQNDWKVLPMAALIAGLVGMVIRNRMFLNMEGTLMGSFAMVCVCIWNGCFNSIQVICRERDVIKREHRSGMHISSYVFSHMLYQALLCLLQTGVTLYVTSLVGVQYQLGVPLFTPLFILDFGISMFLITYASDMMSLWISTVAHSTTTAMTIMPFVLIFQLVFSGGMLTLPDWTMPLTHLTISNPGLKVMASQGGYNERKVVTIWNQVVKMENKEVEATVTLGDVFRLLSMKDNDVIAELRAKKIDATLTLGELHDILENSDTWQQLKTEHIPLHLTPRDVISVILTSESMADFRATTIGITGVTVETLLEIIQNAEGLKDTLDTPLGKSRTIGELLDSLNADGIMEEYKDKTIGGEMEAGTAIDRLAQNQDVQAHFGDSYTFKGTIGSIIRMLGEDNVRTLLQERIKDASYNADYENSSSNILGYWFALVRFIIVFAFLATLFLENVDKDKR